MYIIQVKPDTELTEFNNRAKICPKYRTNPAPYADGESGASITNPFEVAETVDKPFQTFLCRNIGVITGITFPASQLYCGLDTECHNKNSNYYNPNSHNHRL